MPYSQRQGGNYFSFIICTPPFFYFIINDFIIYNIINDLLCLFTVSCFFSAFS